MNTYMEYVGYDRRNIIIVQYVPSKSWWRIMVSKYDVITRIGMNMLQLFGHTQRMDGCGIMIKSYRM